MSNHIHNQLMLRDPLYRREWLKRNPTKRKKKRGSKRPPFFIPFPGTRAS